MNVVVWEKREGSYRARRACRRREARRFNEAGARTPDNMRSNDPSRSQYLVASMRPGRAPRIILLNVTTHDNRGLASMRPGRAPRIISVCPVGTAVPMICFNEAGARTPDNSRGRCHGRAGGRRASMRPGRAPRIIRPRRVHGRPRRRASMRPGRAPRIIPSGRGRKRNVDLPASMRPGRAPRIIDAVKGLKAKAVICFNEAGARTPDNTR